MHLIVKEKVVISKEEVIIDKMIWPKIHPEDFDFDFNMMRWQLFMNLLKFMVLNMNGKE